MSEWTVEIVEYGTGKVIRSMRCPSDWSAVKCDKGANINLNHERFYTRIVELPEAPQL